MKYFLSVINLFSKYIWIVPLKDKRRMRTVNAFQNILGSLNRKPNKIWVDQGGEFYIYIFKIFLKINNIELHSTDNKGKIWFLCWTQWRF